MYHQGVDAMVSPARGKKKGIQSENQVAPQLNPQLKKKYIKSSLDRTNILKENLNTSSSISLHIFNCLSPFANYKTNLKWGAYQIIPWNMPIKLSARAGKNSN